MARSYKRADFEEERAEARRKALLKHFGSLRRLSAASVEEVMAVPGFGRRTAENVVAALAARQPAAPSLNTATGEILEGVESG